MSIPGLDAQRHLDELQDTLIQRAMQTKRTIALDALDDAHHVVKFQGAYWSVQRKEPARKRWFVSHTLQYNFDIDFETLFLKPGKLVLTQGTHPQAEDFKARGIKVEPILVRW